MTNEAKIVKLKK